MTSTDKCACGCGRTVPPKRATGPAPMYATPACRVAACRRRRALTFEVEPLPDAPSAVPPQLASGSTDDQVARAVLEARAIGFALERLGRVARPEFAWRCALLGEAILAALLDTFGEATR